MVFREIFTGVLLSCGSLNVALAQSSTHLYDQEAVLIERPKGSAGLTDRTTQSGYCCTVFDITKQGNVQNVRVNYCTHDQLADPIKLWVQKFRFTPAMIDGQPVLRQNRRYNQSYFRFSNNGSRVIPGPDGFLDRKSPAIEIPPQPESIEDRKTWVEKYFVTKMSCALPIT